MRVEERFEDSGTVVGSHDVCLVISVLKALSIDDPKSEKLQRGEVNSVYNIHNLHDKSRFPF